MEISGGPGAACTSRRTRGASMSSLFSFSTPVDIDVRLEDEHDRKQVDVKLESPAKETLPVYFDGESLRGSVVIQPRNTKRMQHDGVKIEFIGCIGTFF